MNRFRVAFEARNDLDHIWDYIAEHSPSAADRLMARFEGAFAHIADYPKLGKERPGKPPSLRTHPVGSYVIVYRLQRSHVDIVRVISGFQDIDDLLSGVD